MKKLALILTLLISGCAATKPSPTQETIVYSFCEKNEGIDEVFIDNDIYFVGVMCNDGSIHFTYTSIRLLDKN